MTNLSELVKKTQQLAAKRYDMARVRYINGKINFLDYSNAQYEKDNSRKEYVEYLRKNWSRYYQLREITLFDFLHNKKIEY